jgi:hypothetical protein
VKSNRRAKAKIAQPRWYFRLLGRRYRGRGLNLCNCRRIAHRSNIKKNFTKQMNSW